MGSAEVTGHYGRSALIDELADALTGAGLNLDSLTADELSGFDEFHLGGRPATNALVGDLALAPDATVLDVGCGVGGAARFIARAAGSSVVGIDLTPEFIEAATWLSGLVGMAGPTEFRIASALDLPFDSDTFDAVTMLHVGMNIADKTALMQELARVLVAGGQLAVYDILRVDDGDVSFPVPWASEPSASFLATEDDYVEAIEAADLVVESVYDRRGLVGDAIAAARSSPPAVNLGHLMGERWPHMFGNLAAAFRAGVVSPIQILARK